MASSTMITERPQWPLRSLRQRAIATVRQSVSRGMRPSTGSRQSVLVKTSSQSRQGVPPVRLVVGDYSFMVKELIRGDDPDSQRV